MHAFTSITANYVPKARVLAESVKKFHPEARFHLVVSDDLPEHFHAERERNLFDSIVTIDDLGIPELPSWAFKHSVVEMCTAVKGLAFQHIATAQGAEKVFYFDPDMVVMSRLDDLLERLDQASILVTPHQCVPETGHRAIRDNEICSLKHGVFNLGFLAVKTAGEGRRFIDWWAERLQHYCYDDIPGGLFTDQRWVDLLPCFFEDYQVVREPQYNVATWNLSHRRATGDTIQDILINGRPLAFYHFSGFDCGDQEIMLDVYGRHSPILRTLRSWYIERCEHMGQSDYQQLRCRFALFDNGESISQLHRRLYRSRQDLQRAFPDPFSTKDRKQSYYHWFQHKMGTDGGTATRPDLETVDGLRCELALTRSELDSIKNARSFKLYNLLLSPYRLLKCRLKRSTAGRR